jgi:uncharacterized protein (TIGR02391 family)
MADIKRHFTQGQIEKIAKILGETNFGLTGTEIGHFLFSIGIEDIDSNNTKWKRLYNAFVEAHNSKKTDNYLLNFIAKALEPSRFSGDSDRYQTIINELNIILSFHGLQFKDDGKFHKVSKSVTLSEAERRVLSLKHVVEDRSLHPQLLKYCHIELLDNNYFHAVLEAVKGIASMIRDKTGLVSDGAGLIDSAFGGSNPILCINNYSTETEKSEQRGFVNLLKGLFGTFRNPTAHAPRTEWKMEEQDALDLFTMASYAFRSVDNSTKKKGDFI